MEKRFTIQQQLGMVLAAGFAAGAIFANFPGRPYVEEMGILSSSYQAYILAGEWDLQLLFVRLLATRLAPAALLTALGLGRWRLPALRLFALWASFSLGAFWAACLLQGAPSGIFVSFMALFPHGILLAWGWLQLGKLLLGKSRDPARFLPAFCILALEAVAEAWIHPYLLRFLLQLVSR